MLPCETWHEAEATKQESLPQKGSKPALPEHLPVPADSVCHSWAHRMASCSVTMKSLLPPPPCHHALPELGREGSILQTHQQVHSRTHRLRFSGLYHETSSVLEVFSPTGSWSGHSHSTMQV